MDLFVVDQLDLEYRCNGIHNFFEEIPSDYEDHRTLTQSQLRQLEKENIPKETQITLLQSQVHELSSWKEEHLIQYHTLQVTSQQQQEEIEKISETYEQLMIDIQGKNNEIHSLQTLIQQLQFLDQKKAYEISYLQELDQVKVMLKQQEMEMNSQIAMLRDQLQKKIEFSNDQIQENNRLQQMITEKTQLLEELRHIGYNGGSQGPSQSQAGKQRNDSSQDITTSFRTQYVESFLLGESYYKGSSSQQY